MDEIIIEEVRKRSFLYDLSHPDYKKLKKKQAVWKQIAANVNLTEAKCKRRWKMLRDSYMRCKRMGLGASASNAENPQKKWRYFDSLTFLDNVKSTKNTSENIYYDIFEKEEKLIPDDTIDIESEDSCLYPESENSESSLTEDKNIDSKKFQEFIDTTASSFTERHGPVVVKKPEIDSTTLHFASLAAKIREANIPPLIVNRIEAKVSALVFKELETFYAITQAKTIND